MRMASNYGKAQYYRLLILILVPTIFLIKYSPDKLDKIEKMIKIKEVR